MKIDLHCHTKSIKHGEKKTRNVTKELFKEKIANADVKIVAITIIISLILNNTKNLKSPLIIFVKCGRESKLILKVKKANII